MQSRKKRNEEAEQLVTSRQCPHWPGTLNTLRRVPAASTSYSFPDRPPMSPGGDLEKNKLRGGGAASFSDRSAIRHDRLRYAGAGLDGRRGATVRYGGLFRARCGRSFSVHLHFGVVLYLQTVIARSEGTDARRPITKQRSFNP